MKQLEFSRMKNRVQPEILENLDFLTAGPSGTESLRADIDQQYAEQKPLVEFRFRWTRVAPNAFHLETTPFCDQQPNGKQNDGPNQRVAKALLEPCGIAEQDAQPQRHHHGEDQSESVVAG